MRELSLKERKEISLEILEDLDRICRKKNITYYLAYGTLLGAVRHQGFIPWDDDIDVWVSINDYKRLLYELKRESRYEIIDHLNNQNWPRCFSKLSDSSTIIVDEGGDKNIGIKRGVAVDIFPIFECVKNHRWLNELKFERQMVMYTFDYENGLYENKKGIVSQLKNKFVFLSLLFKKDRNYWQQKLYEREYKKKKTGFYGCPISIYGARDIHSEKSFSEVKELLFENKKLPVPIGYDEILRNLYGDYMVLPEAEKRKTNHNVKAYKIEV